MLDELLKQRLGLVLSIAKQLLLDLLGSIHPGGYKLFVQLAGVRAEVSSMRKPLTHPCNKVVFVDKSPSVAGRPPLLLG